VWSWVIMTCPRRGRPKPCPLLQRRSALTQVRRSWLIMSKRFIPCCSGCLPYEAPRLSSTSDHQGRRGNLLGAALTFYCRLHWLLCPAAVHNVPKIFMPIFQISQFSREWDFMFLKSTKGFFNYIMSRSFMFSQISINIVISMS
jgi:hypothetical protein